MNFYLAQNDAAYLVKVLPDNSLRVEPYVNTSETDREACAGEAAQEVRSSKRICYGGDESPPFQRRRNGHIDGVATGLLR